MQEAIPYSTRLRTTLKDQNNVRMVLERGSRDDLKKTAQENAVSVLARRGCCMSHVVRRLLQGLGLNPAVYDVAEGCEDDVVDELLAADAGGGGNDGVMQLPAVFLGGRWFGGLDRVLATHITGS